MTITEKIKITSISIRKGEIKKKGQKKGGKGKSTDDSRAGKSSGEMGGSEQTTKRL